MAWVQNHSLPYRPKGKKKKKKKGPRDCAAAASVRSGEVEAPDPERSRSRGLQRLGRDLRGRLLPWAARTCTCELT